MRQLKAIINPSFLGLFGAKSFYFQSNAAHEITAKATYPGLTTKVYGYDADGRLASAADAISVLLGC